jgi:hypothetical protein
MYNFRIYIPFGGNVDLLNKAITSIIPQIKEHSSYKGAKIVVINNSGESINQSIPQEVEIWELPFELTHAQEANWVLKDAIQGQQSFCLMTHTDVILLPGAMDKLFIEYEKIKNTKWYVVGVGAPAFLAYNLNFFIEEDVWHDPFLFPFYFMDDHMERIAVLRGWESYLPHTHDPSILTHVISHTIKENAIFKKKNDIAFLYHEAIYCEIWGGLPGEETVMDIYANGILPIKERK